MSSNIIRLPVPAPQKEKKKTKKAKGLMPDGRYRAMCDLGKDENGKRIRIPFYSMSSFKDAKEQADKHKAAQKEGQDIVAAKQTVGAWAETWLKTYGSTGGYETKKANALYVRQIAASNLGKMLLKDVRDVHVQVFANAQHARSKSAVGKIRSVLGRMFGKAVANRVLVFDPTKAVKWTHVGEGTHRALDDREIETIATRWGEHRAGLCALLMLFAGLRRGEVLALRWEDVDLDGEVIHVRHGVHFEHNKPVYGATKTRAGIRDVPMLPPLAGAFTGFYGPQPSPYICISAKGKPVTRSAWEKAWPGLCDALGIKARSHDLRHTFCTLLFDSGVDLKTAQYVMGHEDAAMTMEIYTHLTNTRKTQSVDGLKKWCSKWCSDPKKIQ